MKNSNRINFTLFFALLMIIINTSVKAQFTQTIRGKVVDSETQTPLIGVNVLVIGSNPVIGSSTDEKGNFRLNDVPIGRHSLKFTYISYKEIVLSDIVACLLYTSDAADERSSVDLGGRRTIKKKKNREISKTRMI